jgi:uncharacterized protein YodC (DUF2158 family)
MKFPEPGSLVQLRSGGPVLTVVSVRRKTGQVVCMWFRPGTAKAIRFRFGVKCLSITESPGGVCETGGLWGRWVQGQSERRSSALPAAAWAPLQPWWMDDPSDYLDDESGDWSEGDEPLDDDDEELLEIEDREVDHDDFVDEMDIDSESYARSHADGWFYDDDDPEEMSSDDEDSDGDYDDHEDDEDD